MARGFKLAGHQIVQDPEQADVRVVNTATGEVAIRYGLQGPNKAVVTACATGAQSIFDAVNTIRMGYADVVVTGGAEAPVTPYAMAGFCAMRAMSRRNDEPARALRIPMGSPGSAQVTRVRLLKQWDDLLVTTEGPIIILRLAE